MLRRCAIALGLAHLIALGCAQARLAPRFLSRCPADGPETHSDLGLLRVPVDLDGFYADVRSRADAFEIEELDAVRDGDAEHPILAIRRRGTPAGRTMLVVAGIHGDETAGLVAVPAILDVLETDREEIGAWDVTVVAPANPIGVLHGSRYNGDGCDLNRDFADLRTVEARAIVGVIEERSPDLIVSLHEGPQNGFLLVVTSQGSRTLGEAAVRAVRERGVALSNDHFTGLSLGTPGLSAEGRGTDFLKWLGRLHTLGRFANGRGIGTYTTETSWSSDDFEERARAHVVTVEALLVAGAAAAQPVR